MPGSLILEGLAQTGGILLGERSGFSEIVILAKVPQVTFHSWACPGDTLTYTATLTDVRPEEGGVVDCKADKSADGWWRRRRESSSTTSISPKPATRRPSIRRILSSRWACLGILEVGQAGDGTPTATS